MMRALVLGCGLQGRAAIYDLARSSEVESVVCADADLEAARGAAEAFGGGRVEPRALDARDGEALAGLLADGFDVAVDLLPRPFVRRVAEAAIAAGVHLVSTNYDNDLRDLGGAAGEAGIALLPEMGLDPGIDLVMAGEAVRRLGRVTELRSYGGGVPEPGADDNPLRYRISWTWEGVLETATRPARLIRNGRLEEVPAEAIFDEERVHEISFERFGALEAFPNGDAAKYVERLGLGDSAREVGRYTLRWPGHCRLWRAFARLGFLSEEPIASLGGVTPRRFLVEHLGPRLGYGPEQRDLVFLRVEARAAGGERLVFELVDARDLETGLMAMNRTVGFAAAAAARLIASSEIRGRGLLSPVLDVPWAPFVAALERRGLEIAERSESVDTERRSG